MQVDVKYTASHFWLVALSCALGGVALGTIVVISCWIRKCRSTYRKKKKKHVRRAQSVAEFETRNSSITSSNKRLLFRGRSVSSEQDNSESEHSEKSPLVSAKLDSLAKLLFNKSLLQDNGNTNKECESPTRYSTRYQYTALDSGIGASDRSPRERAARDRALTACQEWILGTDGRYDIIAHLDDIGSRPNKQWFLLNDTTVRTDRLMTLLPIPPDCVALEELPASENPKGILMELLGSLQHPYIYPVLDLGFLQSDSLNYACLVMPFNPRGSLKDLIYKSQWNEPFNRKYTRKSSCLPMSQVQRLGRQILEALLFLRERGFPSHGHLHSGNVILQNGVARLSGLENGLLGLNSRVNAVNWSRGDIDHIDVICFGHLLFEMCAGYELGSPQPSPAHLELELERYPQVAEVLSFIFDSPDGRYPTIEELVLCDLFRNIDLREMRGTCIPSFKHGLSTSTLSLLNAVRRRQAVLISSHSEGSSPCTPPSTPRERRTGDLETSDIASSDSDIALDEIIIEPSANIYTSYDPSNSPIHYCDNSIPIQSDENSLIVYISPNEDSPVLVKKNLNNLDEQCGSNQKNSKSRRIEYSMIKEAGNCGVNSETRNNMKLTVSSNYSQDSAFGSMTDGDLSLASSFRLSSFQSISSPIDESVEDLVEDLTNINLSRSPPHHHLSQKPTTSASSQQLTVMSSDDLSIKNNTNPSASDNLYLELPTVLINDQRSIYTSSPSKKFGSSIEVFSQKYRVSSFEDMSTGNCSKNKLKNLGNTSTFRSLEEERNYQIDSAFLPIKSSPTLTTEPIKPRANNNNNLNTSNKIQINNNEKYKKLTHSSFTKGTPNDKHNLWKNSILSFKNNLIKSNESLIIAEPTRNFYDKTKQKFIERVNSINEISKFQQSASSSLVPSSSSSSIPLKHTRKSKSERILFPLTKLNSRFNHSYDDNHHYKNNRSASSSYLLEENLEKNYNSSSTDSLLPLSSHGDAYKSIGAYTNPSGSPTDDDKDEEIPLLDGIEMLPLTPTEPEELL